MKGKGYWKKHWQLGRVEIGFCVYRGSLPGRWVVQPYLIYNPKTNVAS